MFIWNKTLHAPQGTTGYNGGLHLGKGFPASEPAVGGDDVF